MALPIYLAMNPQDFRCSTEYPPHICWMACHFSSWDKGLSNFPIDLPPNGMLMLDDSVPPSNHNPELIARQLRDGVEKWKISGVILDFQRPYEEKIQEIADAVQEYLPCPAAVTEPYLSGWNGAVFLPPVPLNKTVQSVLSPWKDREIWLELDDCGLSMQLRESGCVTTPLSEPVDKLSFCDEKLCCHYRICLSDRQADFLLQRTDEDHIQLLKWAETLGVSRCVGLYREYSRFYLSTPGHSVG